MSIPILALGFLLDLIFGDPHWMPHLVRLIGLLIEGVERVIRPIFPKHEKGEQVGGAVFALLVIVLSVGGVQLLLTLVGKVSFLGARLVEVFLCYQIFATKSLRNESLKVCDKLEEGNIQGARKAVSMIVGRDTESLSESQVAKATVETVAENTSDGIIAPMLLLAIGGIAGGVFYKAVNTMDSMVGYQNEKYLHFGRFAAKLDDLVNLIPARFAAIMMVLSAKVVGLDAAEGWRIYRRDRKNHASPNSAQTEAVCAGALGVQLAGDAYYFGKLYPKPTIGDDTRPIESEDIVRTCDLMYGTAILSLILVCAVRFLVQILVLI